MDVSSESVTQDEGVWPNTEWGANMFCAFIAAIGIAFATAVYVGLTFGLSWVATMTSTMDPWVYWSQGSWGMITSFVLGVLSLAGAVYLIIRGFAAST